MVNCEKKMQWLIGLRTVKIRTSLSLELNDQFGSFGFKNHQDKI